MKTRTKNNVTYSFFCDESGTFNSIDTHVICPMIVVNIGSTFFQMVDGIWSYISPDIPYSKFHAVTIKNEKVQQIVRGIFERILSMQEVYAVYALHRSKASYGFDFHLGMVYHLVVWEINQILKREIARQNKYKSVQKQIRIKVYLAERSAFNNRYFESYIQKNIRNKVRGLVKEGKLKPDQVSFQIQFFVYPIAENSCLVISDGLCHVVRAYCQSPDAVKSNIKRRIKMLPCMEISSDKLDCAEIRSLTDALKSPWDIRDKTEAEILIQEISNAEESGRRIKVNTMERILSGLLDRPSWYRSANFDQLFEGANRKIRKESNYRTGELLIEALFSLLAWERNAGDISDQILNERELRVSDLYLTVNNHKGFFLPEDLRIVRAQELSRQIMYDIGTWKTICTFANHLAVALQNVFHFQEAIESLETRIRYFEQETQNPFVGAGLKAREIGALFGTHAQSLAFDAHCSFFSKGVDALAKLEDAELYSIMASDHFENETDKQQQLTYRSHFKMQHFILTGEGESLNSARNLLESEDDTVDCIQNFLESFPEKNSITPAYRISALLKLAYLGKETPGWLKAIIEAILKGRGKIPAYHPFEQIIAYNIMLSSDENDRRRLSLILKEIPFSKNIVNAIKQILMQQATYDFNGRIEAESVKAIQASITDDIRPQWESYDLGKVLKNYLEPDKIDRWHVGPMEVLPFNYC